MFYDSTKAYPIHKDGMVSPSGTYHSETSSVYHLTIRCRMGRSIDFPHLKLGRGEGRRLCLVCERLRR